MMQDGRPLSFVQTDPDAIVPDSPATLSEEPGDPATPPVVERRPDRLGNALTFGTNWTAEPVIPMQAKIYPDTVKVVGVRYRVFDTGNVQDMDEYSKICLSDAQCGRFVFSSSEITQWAETASKWLVLVRVTERIFKSLSTSNSDPNDP